MMFFILVLPCMIAGSLACSDAHCKDPALGDELVQVGFLPNKEQLRTLCPKVISFLECERAFLECPGQSLDELAVSSDKIKRTEARRVLVGIDLIRNMCDEDSSFHNDYVNCYRRYSNRAARNCTQDIAKPVQEFFDQLYADEDDISGEIVNEIRCLKDAFQLACVIDNIGDVCGDAAERAARNALEGLKSLLGSGSCDNLKNTADLKSRFLDFLELDEQKKRNVQGIFDLFKRRR
ncbi:hypothetical protein AVEN_75571-1 [Araneus ventricosus]|uniref:DUF19 domain-containing protein n=1 Tax=Araneus ventricosus TaxID=182803 RepID=A0A4Y2CJR3_ARAVE|nr:hypothetical protein AVEN_75571-1 [Araneus ventricosus]